MNSSEVPSGKLEALMRQMGSSEGFPALSHTISEINKIASSENSSTNSLTKAILQDVSLTTKLLKLVNTVSYGQFGGKINTISKAVVILGFDVVRNAAMTLILIEFLQNKSQAKQLMDEVVASFFSGLVARELSACQQMHNLEEAMICGIFHHLGKLLATYYFYDESEAINQLVAEGVAEEKASSDVLGISYADFGVGIAKSWNFPNRLIAGMQSLSGGRINKPANEIDHLNITVNLASELTRMVGRTDKKDRAEAIKQLLKRYENAGKFDEKQLNLALMQGLEEIAVRGAALNINLKHSDLLKQAGEWTGKVAQPVQKETEVAEPEDGAASTAIPVLTDEEIDAVLQAGIQDVTNSLVTDFRLTDLLSMVLETMYRGMQFNAAIMLLRDVKSGVMRATFGFGAGVETMLPNFRFPLKFEPDVFHLAIEKGLEILIEDIDAENIAGKIPLWYRELSEAKSFILLPVVMGSEIVACIYADVRPPQPLKVSSKQLGMLRTLRNQAVLALRQKQ